MVISVLERRSEIGLRRSLGATRGHIRVQFLVESLLLSAPSDVGGALLGIAVTTAYARYQDWPVVVPPGRPRRRHASMRSRQTAATKETRRSR